MNLSDTKIDSVGVRSGREVWTSENLFRVTLGGRDVGNLLREIIRQAAFRRCQILQRHVVLFLKASFAVTITAPSLEFGERLACLVFVQLGDQRHDKAVEFGFRQRQ